MPRSLLCCNSPLKKVPDLGMHLLQATMACCTVKFQCLPLLLQPFRQHCNCTPALEFRLSKR
jgi:hypothetical protein